MKENWIEQPITSLVDTLIECLSERGVVTEARKQLVNKRTSNSTHSWWFHHMNFLKGDVPSIEELQTLYTNFGYQFAHRILGELDLHYYEHFESLTDRENLNKKIIFYMPDQMMNRPPNLLFTQDIIYNKVIIEQSIYPAELGESTVFYISMVYQVEDL